VSEHADQFEGDDEPRPEGSESGGEDRREGTEDGNWESGTGPGGEEGESTES
jgi:hypothetical protein